MRAKLLVGWSNVVDSYWFVPSLMAIVATVLALFAPYIEVAFPDLVPSNGWFYSGGPQGARAVLSTIAGSVVTVAGTTFSITIAALTLASGQFGPRILRSFMRDRGNQIVLGTFTSTFLYCLLVLRTVSGTDKTEFVPHLGVTLGVALAVLSVGVLIYFVHHAAESIQVSHVIDVLGQELDDAVRQLFPANADKGQTHAQLPSGDPATVNCVVGGYVQAVDTGELVTLAKRHNAVVQIVARPGDYAIPGTALLCTWPAMKGEAIEQMRQCFAFGRQRTTIQDAEFAFLQVAEVGVRALSPGINDPFTAVLCVDRLTAAYALLAHRPDSESVHRDSSGHIRVFVRPCDRGALVRAGFGAILDAAKTQPMVLDRLRVQMEFLQTLRPHDEIDQALRIQKSRIETPRRG